MPNNEKGQQTKAEAHVDATEVKEAGVKSKDKAVKNEKS
jgi:hypothetical protein